MSSISDDSDGKDVGEPAGQPRANRATVRGDEGRGTLAKGTRSQASVTGDPAAVAMRSRRAGELDHQRDPAEVLRMWPHSIGVLADRLVPAEVPPPAPAGRRRPEDKIALAHLALELYRETEAPLAARGAPPVQRDAAVTCTNPACEARINALRGALVEACLLVQRVVRMTPEVEVEVEGRVRELLELIKR
jgi:hypothetical protein